MLRIQQKFLEILVLEHKHVSIYKKIGIVRSLEGI